MEFINLLAMSDPNAGKIMGVVLAKIIIVGFLIYSWKKQEGDK
jgi:hypothetical protein